MSWGINLEDLAASRDVLRDELPDRGDSHALEQLANAHRWLDEEDAARRRFGEAAEAADRRRVVKAALAELPAEQRETLELAYYSGLSQTEIAERTGTPLGTVKTRMRLALQKLRDRLAGHAEALA